MGIEDVPDRVLDDGAELVEGRGEGPFGFEHPELGEVTRGLGTLRAEAWREGVHSRKGCRDGFEVKLGGDGEVCGVVEVFRRFRAGR